MGHHIVFVDNVELDSLRLFRVSHQRVRHNTEVCLAEHDDRLFLACSDNFISHPLNQKRLVVDFLNCDVVVTSLDVLTIESLVREGQEAVVVFLVLRHAFHKLP